MLHLTVHDTIDGFLHAAEADLVQDEVTNGLILGVALRIKHDPERFEHRPYLATVHDEAALAAAAVMTPPYGVVVYVSADDPAPALRLIVENLVADGWPVPTVNGVAHLSSTFADEWRRLTGGNIRPLVEMRVYALRAVIAAAPVPGRLPRLLRHDARFHDAKPRLEVGERDRGCWANRQHVEFSTRRDGQAPIGFAIPPIY